MQGRGSAVLWGRAWHAASAILLVYPGLEKLSTSEGFKVLMFQLSLVLYLSRVCLQPLGKVPGSWSSGGLWLCPGCHLDIPFLMHSIFEVVADNLSEKKNQTEVASYSGVLNAEINALRVFKRVVTLEAIIVVNWTEIIQKCNETETGRVKRYLLLTVVRRQEDKYH
jgi:hypothetical protein